MHLSSRLALLAYKTLTTLVAPLGASFLAYKKEMILLMEKESLNF